MIARQTADIIIMSRLLVLQSKRLMLNRALCQLARSNDEARAQKVVRLRNETESAQHNYRSTILAMESPERHEYWLVVYGRLIDMGGALITKLRDAAVDLPYEERFAASTDVEMLESILEHWTESMRTSMTAGVA
jgi:hypothetical protein